MNNPKNVCRRIFAFAFVAIAGLVISGKVSAQEPAQAGTTMNAIHLKTLHDRKAEIKKEIEIEDKKRGRNLEGVSPETMEKINVAQDSLCLELRSRLVAIELEITELTEKKK